MKYIFEKSKLMEIAEIYNNEYKSNSPFPHIAIDNFLDEQIANKIHDDFPKPKEIKFYEYDNPLEKKSAMDKIDLLPDSISNVLLNFNSPIFLEFLEKLSGIEGLIPDPYFRGGGIHQSKNGGKLDVHIDFNKHPKLKIERRINVLIYLNKNWKKEYNGDFQLWKGEKINENHKLERLEKRIYPIFNRFVAFNTSQISYHGFPEPIKCPENITRNSLALYYYTADKSAAESMDMHSTVFVKLPGIEDGLDNLRNQRKTGRLKTNIN